MANEESFVNTQIILTWVSGSWKTTLLKKLMELYPEEFALPLQYTTRKPRWDSELDQYIFLNHQMFLKKLVNWDFIEYICYNKELYWIGKFFDKTKSNVFIAEPVGREALVKYFKTNNIPFIDFYLEIDEEMMIHRLGFSRREAQYVINERLEDFKYFHPLSNSIILDGTHSPEWLAEKVLKARNKNNINANDVS